MLPVMFRDSPSLILLKAAAALARQLAQSRHLEIEVDGEFQLDTALRPEAAHAKSVQSAVAGRANVLVFPDLASGHIAAKLVALLGGRAYGQILAGLTKPAAAVSRSDDADTITAVAAIVGLQAIEMRRLQEMAEEEKEKPARR